MKNKFLGVIAGLCLTGKVCLAQTAAATDATEPAIPPPPAILPFSPLAQIIRLVQAGVDQSVILAYATNSISTFNLDSDKIIYLANLGVPNEVTTAMMQRDRVLQQQMAVANIAPPPTPAPATTPTVTDTTMDTPPPEPAVVTVEYFQTTLAPYGSWVNVDGYGRCWRPTAVAYSPSWQPYCDRGHWVYSDAGWYWASDYAWGATFHYGRWFRDSRAGWCWWPDTTWAPSWVTWRYADDYCGWAPLPPFAVYRPGTGFVYRGNGVSVGFDFGLNAQFFTFVPTRNFCDPHPRRFRAAPTEVTRIYGRTTVINNINFNNHRVINDGITVQHIADATRTQIRAVPVHDLRTQNNQALRGGNFDRPVRRTDAPDMGNARPTATVSGNENDAGRRVQNPGQNRSSQPVINGNPQAVRDWSTPAPTTAGSPDNNNRRHIESPRAQQIGRQTPNPITPAQTRDFSTPLPPPETHSPPVAPPRISPQPQSQPQPPPPQAQPQIPVQRPAPRNDSRPNNAVSSGHSAPSSSDSSSQSSQSQSPGRRDNDRSGQGR